MFTEENGRERGVWHGKQNRTFATLLPRKYPRKHLEDGLANIHFLVLSRTVNISESGVVGAIWGPGFSLQVSHKDASQANSYSWK
jgi:hypothetical protein